MFNLLLYVYCFSIDFVVQPRGRGSLKFPAKNNVTRTEKIRHILFLYLLSLYFANYPSVYELKPRLLK